MRVLFYYGCLLKIDFQLIPNRTPFFLYTVCPRKFQKNRSLKVGKCQTGDDLLLGVVILILPESFSPILLENHLNS